MERENIRCTSVQEIIGKSPTETLVQLRTESQTDGTGRSPHVFFPALQDGIQLLTVIGGHVLHVGHVLQASLNLQRRGARIQQGLQVVALVHVFQRQQVLAAGNRFPVRIHHVEAQAAELRTLSAVGTAAETCLTHVALSAVAHAQGAVYEYLQRRIRTGGMNLCNLVQRQLTGQYHLTETGLGQEFHFLRRAVVHLCTGMQRNRGQIQTGDSHVLYDEGIHPHPVQIPNHFLGICQFLFLQDGIDSHVNAYAIQMGITHQGLNVFQ